LSFGDEIAASLAAAGIEVALATRLGAYGQLVLDANRAMNVTAARSPAAFAEHILDALTLTADIDGPLIDLGSGAGLPGIPLAIATGQRVVLVDSIKKKVKFLARALAVLELWGEAVDERAEVLARDPGYREKFRCATARGVAVAPVVAELTIPFLALGGRALLQRGSMDERERQAMTDAAAMLGAEVIEERLLGDERRVLVCLKRTSTQQRFPRREGIPQKRPLCYG
jgi:16S rRNA (guanine527-N7)-methyltransferase